MHFKRTCHKNGENGLISLNFHNIVKIIFYKVSVHSVFKGILYVRFVAYNLLPVVKLVLALWNMNHHKIYVTTPRYNK